MIRKQKRFAGFQRGFSLTELLIVVALIAVLMIVFLLNFNTHQERARDSRRKADLDKIKIAFENYYNDHGCYPDQAVLNQCNGNQLQPYMDTVPCDPFNHLPYTYIPDSESACKGYRVLTHLEDTQDPSIAESGCNTSCGCGFGSDTNYGISSGQTLTTPSCTVVPTPSPGNGGSSSPTATPHPTVTPNPGTYACSPGGVCNLYANPGAAGCHITYADPSCENACSNPANRCAQ